MKLGVFNPLFHELSLEQMLDKLESFGLEAVELRSGPNSLTELRAGRYPAQQQCDPAVLLADAGKLKAFRAAFASRGIMLSGLSCHGNPLHPDKAQARAYHESWRNSVQLAEQLGVKAVIVFSGCPGANALDTQPNWATINWPPEFAEMLAYQWNEVAIPYWRAEAAFARAHGINIAVEMHPGFMVYNLPTMLHLREACGENVGCNFDPSHLFWQQADPVAVIKALKGAIYHFHAKDTAIDTQNIARNGVLDNACVAEDDRAWTFRSVGYGHDSLVWRRMISALRVAGYDHVISIEHEDGLASIDEGLGKAVEFLRGVILKEQPAKVWWI
ncbi:MAG: sugar phosphate isomerase/epimerase [Chloroflexi bacterium]|nr:sugar phosphate isomerase/epimerase [Chloroflexota bacterium]